MSQYLIIRKGLYLSVLFKNSEVNLIFFTGILLFFFHSTKNFDCLSLSILPLLLYSGNPNQTSATYCPWTCFPTFSSLKTLLRHPFQFFHHPFWFSFIYVIFYFLQLSILFLSPFILRSYYLLLLQIIQTIKTVLLFHVLSFNTTRPLTECSNYSLTRLVVQPYNYYNCHNGF